MNTKALISAALLLTLGTERSYGGSRRSYKTPHDKKTKKRRVKNKSAKKARRKQRRR